MNLYKITYTLGIKSLDPLKWETKTIEAQAKNKIRARIKAALLMEWGAKVQSVTYIRTLP